MLLLTVDTSTPTVVVGIGEVSRPPESIADVDVRCELSVERARGHAEIVTPMIVEALANSGVDKSDLDAVIVGCGPGPFTGLRVGMATGEAFADGLGIPAHGVCSLDAIAATGPAGSLLVVTDARRREIYYARYVDHVRTHGPSVQAPAAVAEELAGQQIDHVAGWREQAEQFGPYAETSSVPTVAGLVASSGAAAFTDTAPGPLTPWYLRRPDALTLAEREQAGGRR